MDLSTSSSLCLNAERMHTARAVEIVQWLEILMDIISLTAMTVLIRRKFFRKTASLVNRNMKVIGAFGIFFYYTAILFSIALHVYFKILRYTAENACDFVWSPLPCIFFRLPVFIAFVGFSVFHLVLFIERATSTFGRGCVVETRCGVVLITITITLPVLITLIPLSTDNFHSSRSYCFSNSAMSPIYVVACMSVTAVSDIFVAIGDVVIYIYNRRSLLNKHSSVYTLDNSFRLRETQLSMNIIFPFATIHASVFMLYVISVIASNFYSVLSSLDKTSALLQIVSITKSVYLAGVPMLVLLFVRNKDDENWVDAHKRTNIHYNYNW
ncbi:hypothetical protein M3Y95_01101700 [Aphelenchoides besseyi]|nr:hypothetical protein M3Y95_01101700 [Aphelenchoides besseyi]